MNDHLIKLAVPFIFVILLVAIKNYFQWQRHKLWHETARLALEKDQPLPGGAPPITEQYWHDRRSEHWDVRRGLVFIAVGAALFLALPTDARLYGAIPGFIGVALLLYGLFGSGRSSETASHDEKPGSK